MKHLSVDYQLPVVIVRIFSFYGPRGGGVTQRIDQLVRGEPVSVYPAVRNVHTPLYEDDYVEKTIMAASIAKVGAQVVNIGGTEPVTTQEYCQMAGEILGNKALLTDPWVFGSAWQGGAVAAEGEHGQGDECFGGAESERDPGQQPDLGVGGFDQSLG